MYKLAQTSVLENNELRLEIGLILLGFIARSVKSRSGDVILKLYLALVRPYLDFALQFWSSYYRMDIGFKWVKCFDKRDVGKVLTVRTGNNGFNLEKCRFRRDRQKLIYK